MGASRSHVGETSPLGCLEGPWDSQEGCSLGPPPWLLFSNSGSDPYPNRAIMATEQRGGPITSPAPARAPPSPGTPPTRVMAASYPEERCNLCPHQMPLAHQSYCAHAVSHTRTPFQTYIGTEAEKVKQNQTALN